MEAGRRMSFTALTTVLTGDFRAVASRLTVPVTFSAKPSTADPSRVRKAVAGSFTNSHPNRGVGNLVRSTPSTALTDQKEASPLADWHLTAAETCTAQPAGAAT